MEQPATDKPAKVSELKENKRILITSVNGLLGHSLFEFMRNDHTAMTAGTDTAHRFLGTFNSSPTGGMVNASPSDAIKLLDSAGKPKTFEKQVRNADFIVLDISQFSASLEEAQRTLKALKYHEAGLTAEKPQVLVVVSSAMTWSNTPCKADGAAYSDRDLDARVPLPKYQ